MGDCDYRAITGQAEHASTAFALDTVTRVNSYASFDSGPRFDPGRGPAQKRDAGIAYRTLRIRPGLYSSG